MNGLEQILLKIDEDNKASVDEIIKASEEEAQKNISDAKLLAEKEASEIVSKAEKEALQICENAKSNCESVLRLAVLKAKTQIIDSWIKKALSEIKNADDKTYFEILKKLLVSHSYKGKGTLLLNKKDRLRIPDGFIDEINGLLKEKNACVELGEEAVNIDSGFIIKYGGIEENCTFDALIEDKMDEIKDKLFAQLNA